MLRQKAHHLAQDILRAGVVRGQHQIGMLAGVSQPALLAGHQRIAPVAAVHTHALGLRRHIQKDQIGRRGNALPHGRRV